MGEKMVKNDDVEVAVSPDRFDPTVVCRPVQRRVPEVKTGKQRVSDPPRRRAVLAHVPGCQDNVGVVDLMFRIRGGPVSRKA